MTTRTSVLLLALLGGLFAFSACEEVGEAVEASASCTFGELRNCEMTGVPGCSGTMVCGGNGVFGACVAGEGCTGAPCSTGESKACEVSGIPGCFGTMICSGGGVFGSCVVGSEICGDNVDNNCNSQIDEGCTGNPGNDDCTTVNQVDTCLTTCDSVGTRKCGANKKWGQCIPPDEICNGLDDNCNTVVDDGVSRACSTKCGQGIEICDKGEFKSCTAPPENPEICDGQDNDCDGKVDTAANGTPLEVACTGICGLGSQVCIGGQLGACSSNGTAEICNSLDDDCNGIVDDAPGGCTCSAGETQLCGKDDGECSQGIQDCLGGQWSACKSGVHTNKLYTFNQGSDELCDLLDNDCDGNTDEGNPGGGAACGTQNGVGGMQLPCQLGLMSCLGGELTCIGGVDPEPEICDDIDNDCDGETDEENSADNYESNNSCQNGTYETVTQGAGKKTLTMNLYPQGDFDWLEIKAKELADFCFNDDSEGPYQFTVKMTPPPGLDYDLCVWPADTNSCGALPVGGGQPGNCDNLGIFVDGLGPETYTYPPAGEPCWDGGCGDNDDRSFYIKVFSYYASEEDCAPYTIELEMMEVSSENCAPVAPAEFCDNGICEDGETFDTCPQDCADDGPVCDNDICEDGETFDTCPQDCEEPAAEPAVCPDGYTESDPGFDFGFGGCETYAEGEFNNEYCVGDGADVACPSECGTCPACDDGTMDDGEWVQPSFATTCEAYVVDIVNGEDVSWNKYCAEDGADVACPVACGTCNGDGPVCGNGVCESSESEASCPADCVPADECNEVCAAACVSAGESCVESCAGPCLQGCASEYSACNDGCGGFPPCLGGCSSDNNTCVEGCSVGNNTCEMGCGLTEASCTSDCGC